MEPRAPCREQGLSEGWAWSGECLQPQHPWHSLKMEGMDTF